MNFKKWQIASLRATSKSFYTLLSKKKRLEKKKEEAIAKLDAEIAGIDSSLELLEAPIKTIFEGYGIEDLISKIGEGTEAKYVLLHPETIIPETLEIDSNEESVTDNNVEEF